MAILDADGSSPRCLIWFGVGDHLALSLHSSNETGELLQWFAMMTAP